MATKVFISWSGDLSQKIAQELRDWLPAALQFVKPYFSPTDIEKGRKWSIEVQSELEKSDIGIICLTKENTTEPWILFESGALSKKLTISRVCPILFNLTPSDIEGPLALFQQTLFNKTDFNRLVKTINGSAGDSALEEKVLEDVFELWWPKLEEKVNQILHAHETPAEQHIRSDREILEEILEILRYNNKVTDWFKANREGKQSDSFRWVNVDRYGLPMSLEPGLEYTFHSWPSDSPRPSYTVKIPNPDSKKIQVDSPNQGDSAKGSDSSFTLSVD